MSNLKYILAIDFETSGFISEGGRPIECAAILLDLYTMEYVDSCNFHMYLESGEIMSPGALATHGKTTEWLQANGISREEGSKLLLEWLFSWGIITSNKNMRGSERGQLMPMGQNVQWDLDFMTMLIGIERMKVFTHHVKDTMHVASFINDAAISIGGVEAAIFKDSVYSNPSASLLSQMQYYGFDTSQAHGALYDVKVCIEIWKLHVSKLKNLMLK